MIGTWWFNPTGSDYLTDSQGVPHHPFRGRADGGPPGKEVYWFMNIIDWPDTRQKLETGRISCGPHQNAPESGQTPDRSTSEPRISPAEAVSSQPDPARVRRCILLVEDHADTGIVFKRMLEHFGYDVQLATNVSDAIRFYEEGLVDLLVSDIGLPDGSGWDIMRHISSRRKIPAIALSALGTDEDIAKSLEAGFSDHLVKPIDVGELRRHLAAYTEIP